MQNGRNGARGLVDKLKEDAIRYFKNGMQRISETARENGEYADAKPIQEGAGVIYLGVLKALDALALTRGYSKNNLPKNDDQYRELLAKHPVHNGKLMKAFDDVYSYIHLGIYYREKKRVTYVKEGIDAARYVIEKLTGKRINQSNHFPQKRVALSNNSLYTTIGYGIKANHILPIDAKFELFNKPKNS